MEPGVFLFRGITLVLIFIEAHCKAATQRTFSYTRLKWFA